MKSELVKLSLALLSAVFILGCQDQGAGPVGPDGLVPQFDKAGTGNCRKMPHDVHCHGGGELGDALFNVTVMIGGETAGEGTTTLEGMVWEHFVLNFDFFNRKLMCSMGDVIVKKIGLFSMAQGDDHVHVWFQFTHSELGLESRHTIEMGGVLASGDLPPVGENAVIVNSLDGHWTSERLQWGGC